MSVDSALELLMRKVKESKQKEPERRISGMRTTIANAINSVLPVSPDAGPPLPALLNIRWPRMIQSNVPGVVYSAGNMYRKGKLKTTSIIRGY